MSYIFNILISIDQLGNAIAGGNPDCTISGRVGYFANHAMTLTRWYWIMMQFIINRTFFPLDGSDHCHYAYHNDEKEEYIAPNSIMMFILSLITIFVCVIIAPVFYVLLMCGLISPKRNKHYKDKLKKD